MGDPKELSDREVQALLVFYDVMWGVIAFGFCSFAAHQMGPPRSLPSLLGGLTGVAIAVGLMTTTAKPACIGMGYCYARLKFWWLRHRR